MMKHNAHGLRQRSMIKAGCIRLLTGLTVTVLGMMSAQAQPARKSLSEYDIPGLKAQISADLKGIDIADALDFFALKSEDLKIVASPQVSGTVRLYMADVTVGQALETALAINRLAYVVEDGVIHVMSANEYKTLYGVDFYDMREVRTYQLKYASAQDVAQMLQNVKSEKGEIIYNDKTGILILKDIPSRLDEMETIVEGSEIPTLTRPEPTETQIFRLQYARIEDIQGEINNVLTPELGRARYDKRTNTAIITDLPHKLEEVERLVTAFDHKSNEVFIEARIVQVTLSDTFRWGIDWNELAKWSLPVEFIGKDVDLDKANLSLMTTNNLTQNLVFDALKNFGDTKLLSDPRITVEDGNEATLQVVTSEAYEAGSSEVDSGGVTTSYTNFEFVDVGITLTVIPKINDEGFINMLIRPEVSSIASWYGGDAGPAAPRSQGSVPVIKRSTAETTVTVKDGVTIVIAGLIDENTTKATSKFPLLGDIYGIGKLFTHTSDETVRRETIIFLTPHLVSGDKSFGWTGSYAGKELKGLRE